MVRYRNGGATEVRIHSELREIHGRLVNPESVTNTREFEKMNNYRNPDSVDMICERLILLCSVSWSPDNPLLERVRAHALAVWSSRVWTLLSYDLLLLLLLPSFLDSLLLLHATSYGSLSLADHPFWYSFVSRRLPRASRQIKQPTSHSFIVFSSLPASRTLCYVPHTCSIASGCDSFYNVVRLAKHNHKTLVKLLIVQFTSFSCTRLFRQMYYPRNFSAILSRNLIISAYFLWFYQSFVST